MTDRESNRDVDDILPDLDEFDPDLDDVLDSIPEDPLPPRPAPRPPVLPPSSHPAAPEPAGVEGDAGEDDAGDPTDAPPGPEPVPERREDETRAARDDGDDGDDGDDIVARDDIRAHGTGETVETVEPRARTSARDEDLDDVLDVPDFLDPGSSTRERAGDSETPRAPTTSVGPDTSAGPDTLEEPDTSGGSDTTGAGREHHEPAATHEPAPAQEPERAPSRGPLFDDTELDLPDDEPLESRLADHRDERWARRQPEESEEPEGTAEADRGSRQEPESETDRTAETTEPTGADETAALGEDTSAGAPDATVETGRPRDSGTREGGTAPVSSPWPDESETVSEAELGLSASAAPSGEPADATSAAKVEEVEEAERQPAEQSAEEVADQATEEGPGDGPRLPRTPLGELDGFAAQLGAGLGAPAPQVADLTARQTDAPDRPDDTNTGLDSDTLDSDTPESDRADGYGDAEHTAESGTGTSDIEEIDVGEHDVGAGDDHTWGAHVAESGDLGDTVAEDDLDVGEHDVGAGDDHPEDATASPTPARDRSVHWAPTAAETARPLPARGTDAGVAPCAAGTGHDRPGTRHLLRRRAFQAVALAAAAAAVLAVLVTNPREGGGDIGDTDGTLRADTEELVAAASEVEPGTSIVAEAAVPTVDVYESPDDPEPATSLEHPTEVGGPLVFLVDRQRGEWLRVFLPVRPNGSTGWVRTEQVQLSKHRYRVEVRLAEHRLELFEGEESVFSAPVAIGTEDTPTPGGTFYIKELLKPPDPDTVYGDFAFGLSGFSNVLEEFNGGAGVIGIHGTNDPSVIGQDVSAGCIRLTNEAMSELVGTLPLGTPVEILP